jgi:uncharacterized protein YcgL (UPF0745 family)
MNCSIYKSAKKPDSYLFVEREGDFSRVPASLLRLLGALQWVMSLELTPERKLAQADVRKVMSNLKDSGFHLQLPPGKSGESTPQ